ncbi:3-oxoacyl-(acyl carrier protein) synthase [Caballeronia glebae]|uniref:3-oxoacyl-(Acyl carrier protein) synthase n=1 Tax=Caballeronia glebae TaxID=1777143 RepID=A0A158BQB3_9BURK|nr:beta-ketoacyl synthase N-terminal-like domain-containing protein [Caballeronia glebae]SAK72201.1 3-oxoacyl-(acyl carrier protein) synthase [Caballeronia glebae]
MSTEHATTRTHVWRQEPAREVCVCAIGARTPLGLSAAASAAAVRGGLSAVAMHPFLIDKAGAPMRVALDAAMDADAPIGLRMWSMLEPAVVEALGDGVPQRLRCFIALPASRPGLPESIGQMLAESVAHSFALDRSRIALLEHGHASALMALRLAARDIASGACDVCLVAGVDSYHCAETLEWLDREGSLISGQNRNGFPPGEGAGACLLATRSFAERGGLPILATVMAVATATEPHPIRCGRVCVGEGLSAAVRAAIGGSCVDGRLVTATYCDINGERYRNEELLYTMLRTQEAFVDAHDYECPACCWGDMGAASGVLFAVLAICAGQRGYEKGPTPLLWASSDDGYRAAAVLGLDADARRPRWSV